jgi:hypothetical protein
MRITLSRDLSPRSQDDCALRNAQFFRQKPAQGGVRFSFYRWRLQLDLDRAAMLSHDRIDLRVRNNADLGSCHWLSEYPRGHFPIDKGGSIPAQKWQFLWTQPN